MHTIVALVLVSLAQLGAVWCFTIFCVDATFVFVWVALTRLLLLPLLLVAHSQ